MHASAQARTHALGQGRFGGVKNSKTGWNVNVLWYMSQGIIPSGYSLWNIPKETFPGGFSMPPREYPLENILLCASLGGHSLGIIRYGIHPMGIVPEEYSLGRHALGDTLTIGDTFTIGVNRSRGGVA